MSGGKIVCYVDIASFYSYIALVDLLPQRELLASHGVELDFIPVLIGGINTKTGNRPPWSVPAKAKYGPWDTKRAADRVGLPDIAFPKDFVFRSLMTMPGRALHYVKANYPRETYETALNYLFHCFWTPPHTNLTVPEEFKAALAGAPAGFTGPQSLGKASQPLFTPADVEAIMEAAVSQEMKDALKKATDESLARGAFGLPWLWVKNAKGVEEPFWGSDRFNVIWKFLELPYREVELLPRGSKL